MSRRVTQSEPIPILLNPGDFVIEHSRDVFETAIETAASGIIRQALIGNTTHTELKSAVTFAEALRKLKGENYEYKAYSFSIWAGQGQDRIATILSNQLTHRGGWTIKPETVNEGTYRQTTIPNLYLKSDINSYHRLVGLAGVSYLQVSRVHLLSDKP